MSTLQLLDERVVLGKEFKVYGDIENPLFLAKDVANWIEYEETNVGKMLNLVDEEEKVKIFCELGGSTKSTKPVIMGGPANRWFLTEEGIYELLMQSTKPIAKSFKKEVKKILKEIRLTGGAVVQGREEEFIKNYFPSFSEEVKLAMVQDLRVQNAQLKTKLEKQAPKVEYYEKVLDSEGLLTTTEVAKQLGFNSAQQLNGILYEMGVLRRVNSNWVHYAEYSYLVRDGFIKYIPYLHGSQQLKWTEKGREWLINKVMPAYEQRQRILSKHRLNKQKINRQLV